MPMNNQPLHKRLLRAGRVACLVCLVLAGAATAQAQLLYSFESDLEGWYLNTGNNGISVDTSTSGATLGSQSMEIVAGNGFSWNARVNESTLGSANYDAFNTVAADPSNYTLDFDVTFTEDSFADVALLEESPFSFFNTMVAVNSNNPGGGWHYLGNVIGNVAPNGVAQLGTYQASIPMSQLPLSVDSSYYQLNIGSNSRFTADSGKGVKYYIDNVRLKHVPVYAEETLFSWETPDDPETPINEQYEGWTEGFQAGHVHSITTTGATDGNWALQIDRMSLPDGFTWGSQFNISSVVSPNPSDLKADFDDDGDVDGADFLAWQRGNGMTSGATKEDGDANGDHAVNSIDLGIWQPEFGNAPSTDPGLQAIIDDLVGRIEGADKIAFDVTIDDYFPLEPPSGETGFLNFVMSFSDETGVFYQKAAPNIHIDQVTELTTMTIEINLADFNASNPPSNLAEDGFLEGTNSLRIGIATSTNVGATYQIDNIRLLTDVTPSLGNTLAAAHVPEPSTGLLICVGVLLTLTRHKRFQNPLLNQ